MEKYKYKGVFDRFIYFPIATKISPILHGIGLKPNAITTISFLFGLISIGLFWFGCFALAAISFFIYYVLDCADGIVARKYKMCSEFGEVYDYSKDWLLYAIGSFGLFIHFDCWWLFSVSTSIIGLSLMAWEGLMDASINKLPIIISKTPIHYAYSLQMYMNYYLARFFFDKNYDNKWIQLMGTGEFVSVAVLSMFFDTPYLFVGYAGFAAILLSCAIINRIIGCLCRR